MITVYNVRGGKVKVGELQDLRREGLSWGDCLNPDKKDLEILEKFSKIPLSVIESALYERERPKVIPCDHGSIITWKVPHKKEKEIKTTHLVILVLKSEVITVHKEEIDAIKELLSATNEKKLALFGKNVTDLVFTITDTILKDFFDVADQVETKIENIEDMLFLPTTKVEERVLKRIFQIKKTLIYFHKALTANRETINDIERGYVKEFKKDKIVLFKELYRDIAELVDITSTYRDILTGMVDVYLSSLSNSLNNVMKKLTVYGSFVLVPMLISGIYGMNFRAMPEIEWQYGYYTALGLMVFTIIVMYIFFKKEKWI